MLDLFDPEGVLAGTWHGYYDYANKRFSADSYPITATIVPTGREFHGTMIDAVTDTEHLYRSIHEAFLDRWSEGVARRSREILDRFPDYRIESSLPKESRLEGRISGRSVRFTKSYLGTYVVLGDTGAGRVPILSLDDHRVEYRGVLGPGEAVIEGEWRIPRRGILGRFLRPLDRGGFRLTRQA